MNDTTDDLDRVAALAEHLDSLGGDYNQAAVAVREILSILRTGEHSDYAPLVRFVAELLHDSTMQLSRVREQVGKRITAELCETVAAKGGGEVAELIDTALAMAVRLTAPHMHISRVWPSVGEPVMSLAALADVREMDDAAITANTGIVRKIDPRRRRARVQWPSHARWVQVGEIAAFRVWREGEAQR